MHILTVYLDFWHHLSRYRNTTVHNGSVENTSDRDEDSAEQPDSAKATESPEDSNGVDGFAGISIY